MGKEEKSSGHEDCRPPGFREDEDCRPDPDYNMDASYLDPDEFRAKPVRRVKEECNACRLLIEDNLKRRRECERRYLFCAYCDWSECECSLCVKGVIKQSCIKKSFKERKEELKDD